MGDKQANEMSSRESDVRGCYCVLSICRLLNLLREDLTAGVCDYVLRFILCF